MCIDVLDMGINLYLVLSFFGAMHFWNVLVFVTAQLTLFLLCNLILNQLADEARRANRSCIIKQASQQKMEGWKAMLVRKKDSQSTKQPYMTDNKMDERENSSL